MQRSRSPCLLALFLAAGCEKAPPAPAKSPTPPAPSPSAPTAGSQRASSAAASPAVKKNAEGKIIESPGSRIDPIPDDLPLPPGFTVVSSLKFPHAKETSRTIYGQ